MRLASGTFQILLLLAFVVPAVLFLLTQYKTLKMIKRENRTIEPGLVWIQLIPGVNLIVQFIVVSGISNSLVKEASANDTESLLGVSALNLDDAGSKPAYKTGMAYCTLWCISTALSILATLSRTNIIIIAPFISIAAMICWIVYWVDLSKYKNKLQLGLV